jgi:DNA-binding NarL/FixJ family response regulator
VYLSAAMADKLLKRVVGPAGRESGRSPVETLSDRELDVFRLIGQGQKTQEIADQLHLSVKTVETYRDRIRQKLDLQDGVELTRCAVQWALEND